MKIVPPKHKHEFSLWLDAIRWLAALVVVISHAGGVLLLPLSETPPQLRPLPQYAYSFVAGFSHYAVIIFFVMSGYFVGGSWLRSLGSDKPGLATYLGKRVTRLYVVLLPVLLFTPPLIALGVRLYPGVDGSGIYPIWAIRSGSYSVALCNAAYLQGVACDQAGGNQALWSLPHEFWYYVTFPLLFMGRGYALAGMTWLAVLTAFQSSLAPMLLYFSIWLIGVAVAVVPRLHIRVAWTVPAFAVMLLLARLGLQFKNVWGVFAVDLVLAGLFGCAMISMRDSERLAEPRGGTLHRELSSFSYTLYCSHMPILFLYSSLCMATIGVGRRETPTDLLHWAVALTGILVAVVAAWLLSLVTERNTERVRLFAASLFRKARVGV